MVTNGCKCNQLKRFEAATDFGKTVTLILGKRTMEISRVRKTCLLRWGYKWIRIRKIQHNLACAFSVLVHSGKERKRSWLVQYMLFRPLKRRLFIYTSNAVL
ncbi:hypothetical protein VNO77_22677 [Canavalia gladiata]|uniref:Uncharacterized protein n=1 Tax=Canavalia gladiata TaxID=3824 RepID=A0AAN9QAT0_CANGL